MGWDTALLLGLQLAVLALLPRRFSLLSCGILLN
jgi:hypothetical protein